MLCVEAITVVSGPVIWCPSSKQPQRLTLPLCLAKAVWGPLSFATAISIARTGCLRHVLQIIVSVAHLYGVALYYATCFVDERFNGVVYSRPEFQYFGLYFIGFNAPWVVVPAGE